jgi:protein-S-isoprenylcysteine O-methyltransferase Ste14
MTLQTSLPGLLKKAISIIFFLLLFYVLPLIAKPTLILNWQVIFLALVCSVLFATQPRLSLNESKEKKATDRNTIWLIILVSGLGQIASLVEWSYFPSISEPKNVWIAPGAILLISGTTFRLYAIHALGNYFSSTVQIKEEHKIISTGPYRFLRHPSYTGAYMAMLGSAVFLQSLAGIFIFGFGMLFAYHLRIKTEEQTLTQKFTKEYLSYAQRTYKMFPFIW